MITYEEISKHLQASKEDIQKRQERLAQFDRAYMSMARSVGGLSYCNRSKVGALIVKDGNVVSFGYNGTPSGMENCCERDNVTLPHVIHAEMNAILKAVKTGNSVEGATMYLTLSPCYDCAKLILQSGITKIVYAEKYRDTRGVEFLSQFLDVVHLEEKF